ncbi:MAG: hypothetical protein HYT73_02675 [Candidatus Aenigmarchaeota archaeon]|nr:hypothetical protein [Candidatus Aenigmarchaeota archaeon]
MLATFLPHGAESDTTVGANITLNGAYVASPGFVLEEEPVIQSSVMAGRNGFYGMLWSNVNTAKGLTEADITTGYGGTYRGMDFDASYNFFDLMGIGQDKTEESMNCGLRCRKKG